MNPNACSLGLCDHSSLSPDYRGRGENTSILSGSKPMMAGSHGNAAAQGTAFAVESVGLPVSKAIATVSL
jgi:hypothetical protein